jgi:hypothetical protein
MTLSLTWDEIAEIDRRHDVAEWRERQMSTADDEIIPKFWDLVLQANADLEAVDDATSVAEFRRLEVLADQNALELVKFVLGHGLELLSLLKPKE